MAFRLRVDLKTDAIKCLLLITPGIEMNSSFCPKTRILDFKCKV